MEPYLRDENNSSSVTRQLGTFNTHNRKKAKSCSIQVEPEKMKGMRTEDCMEDMQGQTGSGKNDVMDAAVLLLTTTEG